MAIHRQFADRFACGGKVKVGFVSGLAYGLIPRTLETLHVAAPDIEVEMFEQSSPQQCQGVCEGCLDLGLVFLPVEDQELKMRFLFREPLVAMLPARHVPRRFAQRGLGAVMIFPR